MNNLSVPNSLPPQQEPLFPQDPGVPEILRREWEFTKVYQQHESDSPALREAACLRAQTPGMLGPLTESDLFAGRENLPMVGIGAENAVFSYGYYCNERQLISLRDAADATPETCYYAQALLDYWEPRSTYKKCLAALPPHVLEAFPVTTPDGWSFHNAVAFPLYRLAGINLNYDKLLTLGLGGLRREVEARKKRALAEFQSPDFFDGLLAVIEVAQDAIRYYRDQALALLRDSVNEAQRANFTEIAATLDAIVEAAPKTFRQAAQLFWIYNIFPGNMRCYGRMDVYLGDFYVRDLETKRITEEEGIKFLVALWRLMDNEEIALHRIMVGGMGRRNPENADRFALAAMEATRCVHHVLPNLGLRFYDGQNPALYQKALDVISEGNTHPILYNDDVNVPAVAHAFQVPKALAERYLPFGCGEYVLDHHSIGTPNGVLNLLKVLDVTLRNGLDPWNGRRDGLEFGHFRDFKTFDDLRDAYAKQVDWYMDRLAEAQGIIYRETGQEVCFPSISLLFDDCVERGLPLLAGGAAHLGGTMETFGNMTTADSLTAIKRLVYEEKKFTPDELLQMLNADFAGYESERALLRAVPKYGNDDPEADAMAGFVHNQVCHSVRNRAKLGGMDSYLVVVINNSANTIFGRTTTASADGRRSTMPLSNGNQPTAGNDRRGVACLLSSMARLDPAIHAGAVHNVKFSPDMFTRHRAALEGVLSTYWKRGGTQVMLTVVNRGILEDAIAHPEKYPHLMVRVGGFSAYFVKLEPDVQKDILNRTLY